MQILGIGDAVVDFYIKKDKIYPGGSVVNVPIFAKRFGAEKASFIGIIGNDIEGKHILESLKKEDIDTSRVRIVEGETGKAIVKLNKKTSDRKFIGTNKQSRVQSKLKLRFNEKDLEYINKHDIIHTTISINDGIEDELYKIKSNIISFDFSTKKYWNKKYLNKVCPFINFAFFSGDNISSEECFEIIEYVHDKGVKIVGITRGEKTAIFSKNGKNFLQEPTPTKIKDTMGAGDSFISAFLVRYIKDKDMEEALQFASNMAAKVCRNYGAFGYGKKV